MGTRARLRKIARREAAKLGHDLGCFIHRGSGFYVAYCVKCGSAVGFFTDQDTADLIRKAPGFDQIVYGSGLKAEDLLPPRAQGALSGGGVYYKCKNVLDRKEYLARRPDIMFNAVVAPDGKVKSDGKVKLQAGCQTNHPWPVKKP